MSKIRRFWKAISLPHKITLLILFVAFFVPFSWFEPGKIIFSGDEVIALDPVRLVGEDLSVLATTSNLAASNKIGIAAIIDHFIQAIPMFFGMSDRASEIFYFTFWFVLPGITLAMFMSALTKRYKINQWAVPVSVAFYLFNLYRVANFSDNNHMAIYAVIPLLMFWITRAFDDKQSQYQSAVGFALSTLLAARASWNPPMYLMLLMSVAIFGLIITIAEYRSWRRALGFWSLAITASAVINSFWLVPFFFTTAKQQSLSVAGNLNWLNDLSKHTEFANVVRQIGAWGWFDGWRGDTYTSYSHIYQEPLWQKLTLVPALLVIFSLLFKKTWQPAVISFLVIAGIGTLFAMGVHPPTDNIFRWSVEHLPFFWTLRSPWYKFSNMQALGYATLIGIGIGLLLDRFPGIKWKIPRAIVIASLIIFPAILSFPMFTGQMWLRSKDVKELNPATLAIPPYLKEAAKWLNDMPGNNGVALLPYQGAAIFNWGYSSLEDPFVSYSRRVVFTRGDRIGYIAGETPGVTTTYRAFVERLYDYDPGAAQVARLLGIEYIVVRNDLQYRFYDDHDSPEFIKQRMAAQPSISLVKSFGQWDVYRIANVDRQPIFATQWTTAVDAHPIENIGSILSGASGPTDLPALLYSRPLTQPHPEAVTEMVAALSRADKPPTLTVDSSRNAYVVSGQATKPFALVLNQNYDTNWKIEGTGAKFGETVVANSYAPAWLVTPTSDDGKFRITVDYRPQRYTNIAAVISVIGSLIGIWLYIYLKLRSSKPVK